MTAGSSCRHEFVRPRGCARSAGSVLAQYACEALRAHWACHALHEVHNYSVAKVRGWSITPNDTARASASENQSLRAAFGEPTT